MRKNKVTFRHRVEYTAFIAFICMVKVSPLFLVHFIKKMLGFLGRRISKRHRGIVGKNLDLAFPDYTEDEKAKLKDAIYEHFSSIFVDIVCLYVKKNPGKILKEVEVNNIDVFKKTLEKNQGVILFSAHFGNWELIPFILHRQLNIKPISIAREMNNPLVERKVKQFREYMGSTIIYKKNALRTMLKKLEQNRVVYLLIDQNAIRREAVFVDFFGQTASAVPSVSQLHLKKNKPVIPLFLHYEKDKIVLDFLEEILFKGSGELEKDIQQLTQQCTAVIEKNIRKHPEQWFWFHNRWKTKPPPGRRNHER